MTLAAATATANLMEQTEKTYNFLVLDLSCSDVRQLLAGDPLYLDDITDRGRRTFGKRSPAHPTVIPKMIIKKVKKVGWSA